MARVVECFYDYGSPTSYLAAARLPAIARTALDLPEECWSNLAPGFALACSRHETQYARLFRS